MKLINENFENYEGRGVYLIKNLAHGLTKIGRTNNLT